MQLLFKQVRYVIQKACLYINQWPPVRTNGASLWNCISPLLIGHD